jgi:hypothetical protein
MQFLVDRNTTISLAFIPVHSLLGLCGNTGTATRQGVLCCGRQLRLGNTRTFDFGIQVDFPVAFQFSSVSDLRNTM